MSGLESTLLWLCTSVLSSLSLGFTMRSARADPASAKLAALAAADRKQRRDILPNPCSFRTERSMWLSFSLFHSLFSLLLSLGKQHERRGMRAQKVILRGPFARPPTPFAHSSAPSRCSCGSHSSARPLLGSENTPRSSGAVSPCGCLALPGCYQRAR